MLTIFITLICSWLKQTVYFGQSMFARSEDETVLLLTLVYLSLLTYQMIINFSLAGMEINFL